MPGGSERSAPFTLGGGLLRPAQHAARVCSCLLPGLACQQLVMAAAWASSPLCFAPNICLPAPFPAPTEHELLPAVTAGLQHALLPAATLLSKAGGLNPACLHANFFAQW